MTEISAGIKGTHGARGTYKYQGIWSSIDHILISGSMLPLYRGCLLNDLPFLLEKDELYGEVKPFRTYYGYKHIGGFSDHLPLVAWFQLEPMEM